MLGLAYVEPIGVQNIYVIQTALHSQFKRALFVAFVTVIFDISLALSCFFGIGLLLDKSIFIQYFMLLFGSVILLLIGGRLLKETPEINRDKYLQDSYIQVLTTCFLVTWCNPQAILDGSLILGGFKASLNTYQSYQFIIGVCLASLGWFIALASVIYFFKNKIKKNILILINCICGIIILFYGFKLLIHFFTLL